MPQGFRIEIGGGDGLNKFKKGGKSAMLKILGCRPLNIENIGGQILRKDAIISCVQNLAPTAKILGDKLML